MLLMQSSAKDVRSASLDFALQVFVFHFFWPGVLGGSQVDLSLDFEGEGSDSLAPFFLEDCPRFRFGAKGMVDVEVKTGRSVLLTDTGVDVLGGSHRRGSCWIDVFCVGPSGW
jgi:hypothetical protein